jgi:transcriptional repressor NrdR
VQLCEITVIKKSGDRTPFDRDKLARSLYMAVRKRPINTDQVERLITSIVRRIESSGETEIPSRSIGEMVLESLRTVDPVAYIRFASVYRDFAETKDFEDIIVSLRSSAEEE